MEPRLLQQKSQTKNVEKPIAFVPSTGENQTRNGTNDLSFGCRTAYQSEQTWSNGNSCWSTRRKKKSRCSMMRRFVIPEIGQSYVGKV